MANRKIIAILGLPGAGKTEVIEYLQKKFDWPKVYFGDVTFDEVKARGLDINEQNERMVREDLRAKFGRLHYADQVIKKIEDLSGQEHILVESLYDWSEYLRFKEKFGNEFITIAVYAPSAKRYERLLSRPFRPLTFDQAKSRDYAQIENLFQAGPIAMADYTVINDGSLEYLHSQVDRIMAILEKE